MHLTNRTPWIEVASWIMGSRDGPGSALFYAKKTSPTAYEIVEVAVRVFDRWLSGINLEHENWETVMARIVAAEHAAEEVAERAVSESQPEADDIRRRAERLTALEVLLVGLGQAAEAPTEKEARSIGGNTIGRWLAAYDE
jgi:hypothetical protein